ncbi:B-type flagellar hook-associated protein 2 [Pigmentiphaga litoralis]|uniref:flagellar filament capping protein FliD n=1 Tax=Pigmentiphaga litoralis TaxID=516702 RepID=UPI001673E517|nr:flagellar filament capping protein FliD [Pigmentiphaga litoralis]GGX36305.1 B-type flagellar hook-associated protein 2 [Pigmentiphaga litoralis]
MATVGVNLGTGSGLPLETLVTNLMNAEAIPLRKLQAKEASTTAKVSALGQLSGSMTSLREALLKLTDSNFNSGAATVSEKDVATVTATNKAAKGSVSLEVLQLAQQEKAVSGSLASADAKVTTGQLSFTFGKATNGTFSADADLPTQTVTITSENNSLSGVRDAINKAGTGITASLVNDGNGSRLVFSSSRTGAEKSFQIQGLPDGTTPADASLSMFDYNPSSAPNYSQGSAATGMARLQAAGDAKILLDGLAITKPDNIVSDAIDGLTLTLTKTGTTKVTVSQDLASVKSSVQGMVTAYNALLNTAKQLSVNNPSPTAGTTSSSNGPLAGDSIVRDVTAKLREQLFAPVAGATGPYTSFGSLGVAFQKDGTLKLDAAMFDKAMAADPAGVANLFADEPNGAGSVGLSKRFVDAINTMVDKTGSIQTRVDGLGVTTKALQSQQKALEDRLVQIEAGYRARFAALDKLVTGMQGTQNFLTQQLESLASMRNG